MIVSSVLAEKCVRIIGTASPDAVKLYLKGEIRMEERKIRKLRATAMILGVTGSIALLNSLLMPSFWYTDPIAGKTIICMFEYLNIKMSVVFGLLELSIVFLLLSYAVPQILVGSFAGLWAGFMCWDILKRSAESTQFLSMNLGLGMYMFILSAGLFLASGIVFVIFANKCKVYGIEKRKPPLPKILEVYCSVMLGISIVLLSVFEVLRI